MVAKKTTPNLSVARPFVFKKEWVFDEVPPWLKIDRAAWTRIQQLKTKFIKEVNAEIAKGQR
jgi:hypothetical protein